MTSTIQDPTDASVILTYRCQMRCVMCNIWKHPTDVKKEITPKELEILPNNLKFVGNGHSHRLTQPPLLSVRLGTDNERAINCSSSNDQQTERKWSLMTVFASLQHSLLL